MVVLVDDFDVSFVIVFHGLVVTTVATVVVVVIMLMSITNPSEGRSL
jgi:hypothetical protein